MSNLITATIRTVVPSMVSYFSVWSSARGLELDAVTTTSIETAVIGVTVAAFYLIIRKLGKRWPWVEVLLGSKKTPEYK